MQKIIRVEGKWRWTVHIGYIGQRQVCQRGSRIMAHKDVYILIPISVNMLGYMAQIADSIKLANQLSLK